MRFPKVTRRRFLIVASIVGIASTVFFCLYTAIASPPPWVSWSVDHFHIPVWLLRGWPLASVPILFILTVLAVLFELVECDPPDSFPGLWRPNSTQHLLSPEQAGRFFPNRIKPSRAAQQQTEQAASAQK